MPSVLDVRLGVQVPRTMISIEPMLPMAEGDVRALVARAHPTAPPRPKHWYFVNPTLLAFDERGLVGATSFHIDQNGKTMNFRDVAVDPDTQSNGVGRALQDARIAFGEAYGCTTFVGMTWEANERMKKIFAATGFHACQRIENYYAHMSPPTDGIIYIRGGC